MAGCRVDTMSQMADDVSRNSTAGTRIFWLDCFIFDVAAIFVHVNSFSMVVAAV